MRKTIARSDLVVAVLLALGHIGLYALTVDRSSDWAGFFVFVADVPLSVGLFKLATALSLDQLSVLLVGGTIWWFGLGILISMLTKRVYRFAVRFGSDQHLAR